MTEWEEEDMPYGKWASCSPGPILVTVRQVREKFRLKVLGANVDYDEPLVFFAAEYATLEEAKTVGEAKAGEWLKETLKEWEVTR